ncbi:MAG: CADD family putative folate metabolism protein [Legionellales bacterium]|nr:CADD family putative folate metabolism protein [Legionellales bacterium]
MRFLEHLNRELNELHLLKHPFYQSWNAGELSKYTLKIYANEYYHHVAAFPRYISGIHSLCADINARQVLLGNLIEEEKGDENHPELWLRFAEGLGVSRQDCQKKAQLSQTHALVDGYFALVNTDYETGLGALYAYERQTPEVAHSKIDGLKKHYDIQDERSLQFFTVHQQADEWHTEEIAGLIAKLTPEGKERAAKGAKEGAKLLWLFLDGINDKACAH